MANKFNLQEGSNWEGQIDKSKESKTWGIIEWTKKAIMALSAAAALNAGVALADDSKVVTVPLDYIESTSSIQIPEWATKYASNGIEYSVWEKEDNTLAMKFTKLNTLGWNDSEFIHFTFKWAKYVFDMVPSESLNAYAVTTVMERCDWVDRKWVVDPDKKDWKLKGFKEKRCEWVSDKLNMMAETMERDFRIAQSKDEIAQSKDEIAQSKANIVKSQAIIDEENKKQQKLAKISDLLTWKN